MSPALKATVWVGAAIAGTVLAWAWHGFWVSASDGAFWGAAAALAPPAVFLWVALYQCAKENAHERHFRRISKRLPGWKQEERP